MIDFGFRNGRALLMGGVAAVSIAAPAAWAQSAVRVDIPRGEASATLQTFARQTGVQIFAPAEVVRGVTTKPVSGQMTPLFPVSSGLERQRELAYRAGVNMVMYALTGNYKADQVHVQDLLERLGR